MQDSELKYLGEFHVHSFPAQNTLLIIKAERKYELFATTGSRK